MNIRNVVITIFCCMSFMDLQAQKDSVPARHEFTLQQCIDYGLKHNVQVKNAILDYKIQEQTNKGVIASAYPQINGSLGTTFNPNVTIQSFPNFIAAATYGVLQQEGVKNGSGTPIISPADFGLVQAAFGTKWNASGGVSLSQLLFDGQVFVALQARQATLDFQTKNIELTEVNIKENIYKIYYQLVVSRTQTDQLNANIERAKKLAHDVELLYKNGFQEKIDVDKATVQLVNLQTELSNVDNSVNNGYYGLKLLIGMPSRDTLILTDSITEDEIKKDLLNDNNYAYTDRKDYQYLQLNQTLNAFNVKRYQLSKLPTVSLSGSYSKIAQRNNFSFFGKGPWFPSSYISLNVNVPIFSGFAKNADIEKARLQLEQTKNQVQNLEISIDNDVEAATNSYRTAVKALDAQKRNINLAEEVYNQAKKKYEIGTGSNTEITNAQTDLRIAQNNYTTALYNAIVAKVDYIKAIGKL